MKRKVALITLGCPKNLVDSETMLGLLQDKGWEVIVEPSEADAIIVNTCSFIGDAREESIASVLEAAEIKGDSSKILVVAGCLSQMYGNEIFLEIPEVDAVVGTGSTHKIAEALEDVISGRKQAYLELPCREQLDAEPRLISTPAGQAYIKIAEGCDNNCTYCVIPSIRGNYMSRSMDSIIGEAKALTSQGVRELTLIAQDTTRYGTDIYGKPMLAALTEQLAKLPDLTWIRLLYCYPEMVNAELIEQYVNNEKLVKYIDIPIQGSCDRILKLMGRRGNSADISDLITKLREQIPDIIIRTSLIAGFPGETQEEHEQLCEFVRKYRFDRLGVFSYSIEEKTPAAKLKNQLPEEVKQARRDRIMEIQRDISLEKNKARLGKVYKTIVEGVADDGIFYYGRTYAEAPEIDGKIYFTAQRPLEAGEFVDVKMLNAEEYDITGEVTV